MLSGSETLGPSGTRPAQGCTVATKRLEDPVMFNRSMLMIALFLFAPGCGSDGSAAKDETKGGADASATLGTNPSEGDAGPDQGKGGSTTDASAGDGKTDATGGEMTPKVLARTKGIGRPCMEDDECESGQTCRVDTTNYVAHGQCTVTCDSGEACESAFGKETMCIGAEVCVARCLTDEDCPEQTECIDAGWCKRQGPGSGVPTCTGVSTPCSLLAGSECSSALGCYDDSSCGGVSESCFSQFSSFSCNDVDGCYWSSSSGGSCSGSSRSCTSYASDFSCGDQPGCRWDEGCGGTASACADLPASLCGSQPGCSLDFE